MKRIFLGIFSATLISGCATAPSSTAESLYTTKRFSAPLNVELEVNTGDTLMVEGTYIEGEAIKVPRPLEMFIPGSMFIPFPIRIEAGTLELTGIGSAFKYYCAPEGKATATFPGLGSVIRRGDCVGIRVPTSGSRPEWVVDNSNYNHMNTIWTKGMSDVEIAAYVPTISNRPFKVQNLRRIVFDGKHGGQLHFTLEEVTGQATQAKEFKFDFSNEPTVIGIKGNEFLATSADNTRLKYKWTRIRAE